MQRVELTDRGVIRIAGADARTFLQGLISNDVNRADGSQAVYAALLTPQGKFLNDFFIVADGESLLLDCLAEDVEALAKRLSMYKLRSAVTVDDARSDFTVHALFGDGVAESLGLTTAQQTTDDGIILVADPRLAEAGVRALVPADVDAAALGGDAADGEAYQRHRIALGLPEAPADLVKDKSILLESGFDELHGVDWKKGCYMGQELTARTKYRGLVKKRLVPVEIVDGSAEPGAEIMQNGKVIGDLRSLVGGQGIAMLRLDTIRGGGELAIGAARARVRVPAWMQIPADETESEDA